MNCIYTAFYTNLKSYDGADTNKEIRLKILEYCISSYKKFNPNTQFIIDYINDPIESSAEMYFDKMIRLKNLNYNYNILWVDTDTICLGNLNELFLENKIKARYWGEWDNLNLFNGGVIFYPKQSLYNNFDQFSKDWIKLLYDKKFTGPWEQIPITNLILRQLDPTFNYNNYSIHDNINTNFALDFKYNINPVTMNRADSRIIEPKNISIPQLKILHLNTTSTENLDKYIYLLNKLFDLNLIDYINNSELYFQKCEEFNLTNKNLEIKIENTTVFINNLSNSYIHVLFLNNQNMFIDILNQSYVLNPNNWLSQPFENFKSIIYTNIITGENKIINL
jgi:hypothetical protein